MTDWSHSFPSAFLLQTAVTLAVAFSCLTSLWEPHPYALNSTGNAIDLLRVT